jgi:CRISPR-associated endonuclease Cas1
MARRATAVTVSARRRSQALPLATESLEIRNGVLVLSGYGLRIAVERGHLAVADGIGQERRSGLLAKATCGLSRLVVLGHAGTVSLEALRWLHDVGAAFVQLGADGEVIAATAPPGTDDARLRRAQALATTNGVGLEVARELLREKLARQAGLLDRLQPTEAIRRELDLAREQLERATTTEALRVAEARGAAAYWAAWSPVGVRFATRDAAKIPTHWHCFGSRTSTLANGARRAITPANAILNYAYAILKVEARIACLAVGLDPGLGVLHADQRGRDSLALDLIEPVRPRVDALVLDLLERRVFVAKDLFETREGGCRLMPTITQSLATFAPQIAKWLAPVVERTARQLLRPSDATGKAQPLATPLTQANRSAGRDGVRTKPPVPERPSAELLPAACRVCGVVLEDPTRVWCDGCLPEARVGKDRANIAAARRAKVALRAAGNDPSHGGEVAEKRGATHREQLRRNAEWKANNAPTMTEEEYRSRVLPGLAVLPVRAIASALGVSPGYAARVRKGEVVPHARHWPVLTDLRGSHPSGGEPWAGRSIRTTIASRRPIRSPRPRRTPASSWTTPTPRSTRARSSGRATR